MRRLVRRLVRGLHWLAGTASGTARRALAGRCHRGSTRGARGARCVVGSSTHATVWISAYRVDLLVLWLSAELRQGRRCSEGQARGHWLKPTAQTPTLITRCGRGAVGGGNGSAARCESESQTGAEGGGGHVRRSIIGNHSKYRAIFLSCQGIPCGKLKVPFLFDGAVLAVSDVESQAGRRG